MGHKWVFQVRSDAMFDLGSILGGGGGGLQGILIQLIVSLITALLGGILPPG
jgi:hypothetical protein